MARLKKIAIVLFATSLFCLFFCKTIFYLITVSYLQAHGISATFEVENLSLKQISLHEIRLQNTTFIRRFNLKTTGFLRQPLQIQEFNFDAESIDIESVLDVLKKLHLESESPSQAPPDPLIRSKSFDTLLGYCHQINTQPISLKIDEVVWKNIKIPLLLKTNKIDQKIHASWDEGTRSKGSLSLLCEENSLFLQAPEVFFKMQDMSLKEQNLKHLELRLQNAFIQWQRNSHLQLALPGEASITTGNNQQIGLPSFVLSAQSHLDSPQKIELRFLSKNFSFSADQKILIPLTEAVSQLEVQTDGFGAKGRLNLKGLSVLTKKDAPLLQKINSSVLYEANTDSYKAEIDIVDTHKIIQMKKMTVFGSLKNNEHFLSFNERHTTLSFNSKITELVPPLKSIVQHLSGKLFFGGKLVFKNENFKGNLKIAGKDIFCQSEFGSFEGLNFSHTVNSLKDWSSPSQQQLEIKKINIGPGIENLKVEYEVLNKNKIDVDSLFFNIEKAAFVAKNFGLNVLQRRIENLLLKISNLDLEKVLALGLKNTVQAKGQLSGEIAIHFRSHRPTLSGILSDNNPGHIQYRTGKPQATSLSISDSPMDILNNYLYDFYYQNLSAQISTDEKYDMKMTLSASGHNPSYLGGKPLKLNVNLEQNLLAAMQSMMLTYDLPARLKEKIEKAEK